MAEETQTIKCKACGAPVSYMSGENVLTCEYCGTSLILDPQGSIVKVKEHYLIPNKNDEAAVRSIVASTMGKGKWKPSDLPTRAVISRVERIYLPFWIVNCHGFTSWSGMNERERTVGSGQNSRTEKYWEPDSGTFDQERNWVVFARQDKQNYWGLDAFNVTGKKVDADWGGGPGGGVGDQQSGAYFPSAEKIPFALDKIESGIKTVNGQISQSEAETQARNEITRYQRDLAAGKVQKLTNCQTTIDLNSSMLLHLPLWFITYTYRDKEFRMLIDGSNGQLIKEIHPVGDYDRAFLYSLYTLIPIGITLLVNLILWLTGTFLWFLWIPLPICIIIIMIFWARAYLTARKWS